MFEYLEMQGKLSGKKKQKLHLWRKRDIQKLCEHQAHRNGIRVSRVSAQNTSRLACDGSGAVERNPENHSLCTFRTGKQYNCDLSASYNIGARYFIRELLKPVPERILSYGAGKTRKALCPNFSPPPCPKWPKRKKEVGMKKGASMKAERYIRRKRRSFTAFGMERTRMRTLRTEKTAQ